MVPALEPMKSTFLLVSTARAVMVVGIQSSTVVFTRSIRPSSISQKCSTYSV